MCKLPITAECIRALYFTEVTWFLALIFIHSCNIFVIIYHVAITCFHKNNKKFLPLINTRYQVLMLINFQTPTALLKPFIRNYVIIESGEGAANRVLPDTSLVMAFRYKGEVAYVSGGSKNQLPLSVISGLRKSARLINYSQNAGAILVIFKEAAGSAFFKEPIHELFGDSVPLYNFINKQKLSIIEEQLAEADNNTRRIALIEAFLLSQLQNHNSDKLVMAAVQNIRLNNGSDKIKDVANTLYISQDAFEKRFRKVTGASPKQFSSIIRMKSLIDAGKQDQTLTELAYNSGYFDQAHFNKDFRLFTGQTPTDFFRSPVFW